MFFTFLLLWVGQGSFLRILINAFSKHTHPTVLTTSTAERPASRKAITFRPDQCYTHPPGNPSVAETQLLNLTNIQWVGEIHFVCLIAENLSQFFSIRCEKFHLFFSCTRL